MDQNNKMVENWKKMLIERSYEKPFAQPSSVFYWSTLIFIIKLSIEQFGFGQIMCLVIMNYISTSLKPPALDHISRPPSEIQARKGMMSFTIYCKTM